MIICLRILGHRNTPAIGMAFGMERIVEAIKACNINLLPRQKNKIF